MVYVDITAQGSCGAHCRVQPCSLSCTHTQPWRCWGIRRGGQMCQGKRQPTSGLACGRVRLLTALSGRRGRAPGGGQRRPPRAAAAAGGRAAAASCRLTGTSLQPCGCSSCLAVPKSVFCGLGSLLWRPGGYFKLNLQLFFCIYACLKPVPPLPSHSSSDA